VILTGAFCVILAALTVTELGQSGRDRRTDHEVTGVRIADIHGARRRHVIEFCPVSERACPECWYRDRHCGRRCSA
jgi:hypothetical protein